jgi:hypothetical protein
MADSLMGQSWPRSWSPLAAGELLCWLGLLFHMAKCTERRSDYWPSFNKFMAQRRWDQIHRFWTFNINTTTRPFPPESSLSQHYLWRKVEPVYSAVRAHSIQAIIPSS